MRNHRSKLGQYQTSELGGSRLYQIRGKANPNWVLAIVLALILTYLVVAPVVMLVRDSITVSWRDSAILGQRVGTLTTAHIRRALNSRVSSVLFWRPLHRTMVVAASVTAASLLIGYLLAWVITRTDVKFKKAFATLAVVPFMLPSWSYAAAWITVFKNRRLAGAPGFMEVFGVQTPDLLAYGAIPIIVCLALHYFPLSFLLFGNAFRRIDSQLEESAQLLGASRLQTARRVLLPIMRPAIMSIVLLTFARTVGTFGTPYTLGRPVNFNTLSTSLYATFRSGEPGVMSVIAIGMLLIGAGLVAVDVYVLRQYKRFVTMTGKGQMARPTTLGKAQPFVTTAIALFMVMVIVVPLGILTLSTFMITPGWFVARNFTTQFWIAEETLVREGVRGLLRDPAVISVAWNSVRVAGLGALICALLGTLVGYTAVRLQPARTSVYLKHVSFLPYLIPGIGFGAAYLFLFGTGRGPIPPLYGTPLLMILAMGVMYLPFTSRSSVSSMSQMGVEPEEAAMILGARWLQRVGLIVVPIQRRAIFGGIILAFVQGMKELSLVIMLAVPGMEVLTTLSIRYIDNALHQMSNGIILIIVVITFSLTLVLQRVMGTNLAQGVGD